MKTRNATLPISAVMSSVKQKLMQGEEKPKPLSQSSSAIALRGKYDSIGKFLVACNPSHQSFYTGKPLLAFQHDVPTLGLLGSTYGNDAPTAWLVPEILSVSEFCGCRDKFTNEQMEDTAKLITSAYPWLKVSELLLFFGWFKLGRYGKFYGCLDPMVVTTALQDFVNERGIYLDKIDQQERERKAAEDKKKPHYDMAEWQQHKKELTEKVNNE